MTKTLADYSVQDLRPPGPSKAEGYTISPTHGNSNDDEAHYILKPDVEFYRPWIAAQTAFVWPLGVEGFQYSSNATLGIHHYLGQNDVDVVVTYPDELHITLTGTFPGKRSVDNLHSLRSVILQSDPPGGGKILALPGIESHLLYVQVASHQFNHDQADNSWAVAYSIDFIKTGVGSTLKQPKLRPPTDNPQKGKADPRGKSTKRRVVKGGRRTARTIAQGAYNDAGAAGIARLLDANTKVFTDQGIPSFKIPYTKLPPGTEIAI